MAKQVLSAQNLEQVRQAWHASTRDFERSLNAKVRIYMPPVRTE